PHLEVPETYALFLSGISHITPTVLVPSFVRCELLPDFLAAHPNLSIDLILDDRTIDPIKEGIDVGLRFGPLPDSSLTARKVATSLRWVVGAPTYFERSGIPATPAELISHAAVIYTQDRGGSDTWSFR